LRAGGGDVTTWLGSEWREDPSELLGAERSVFYWLRAAHGKSQEQSLAWTRLYFVVRDAAGWPVAPESMPARFLHDAKQHAWLFNQLARASWCSECRAAPAVDARGVCAWCLAAPIGACYVPATGRRA
jgi:hypothetical protein